MRMLLGSVVVVLAGWYGLPLEGLGLAAPVSLGNIALSVAVGLAILMMLGRFLLRLLVGGICMLVLKALGGF